MFIVILQVGSLPGIPHMSQPHLQRATTHPLSQLTWAFGVHINNHPQPQAIVTPQHMQWPHTYPTPAGGSSVPGSTPPTSGPSKLQPTVPPQDANPPRVRTSTLQTHPNNAGSGSSFNPYGIYLHPSKVVLNIEDDLGSVAASPWSPEEVNNRIY